MSSNKNKGETQLSIESSNLFSVVDVPPCASTSPFLYTNNTLISRPVILLYVIFDDGIYLKGYMKTICDVITSFGINILIKTIKKRHCLDFSQCIFINFLLN